MFTENQKQGINILINLLREKHINDEEFVKLLYFITNQSTESVRYIPYYIPNWPVGVYETYASNHLEITCDKV